MDRINELYDMINSIYYQMFQLELNDEFDDEQFNILIDFLREKINEEEDLVKDFIGDDKNLYNKIKKLDFNSNNGNLIRLSAYVTLSDMFSENLSDKEKMEARIFNGCRDSVLLIYLSFLQEAIDSGKAYRENLLNCKYLGAFANHRIEQLLIDNNFYINKEVDVYVDCMLDLLPVDKISEREIAEVVQASYVGLLFRDIEKLLKIGDKDYEDIDGVAISISVQCMIRACLALMNDSDYYAINSLLYNNFSRLINRNNGKSLEILESLLNGREENKKRVRRISFKAKG